jgi:thioredoxin 1
MNPTTQQPGNGPKILVLGGLLLGGAYLVWMLAGSTFPTHEGANTITLTAGNWQKEVVDSKIPVVVDFWAPWCGPCRQLSPTIDRLATNYAGRVKVGKLNVDDAGRIAAKYQISAIPRVLIFNGGETPSHSFVGVASESELAAAIDSLLARN